MGQRRVGKLFDLTGIPLSPGLSTPLTIGTPSTPMSEYDVFFRDSLSGRWTVRSTADPDVFYGLQVVPEPGGVLQLVSGVIFLSLLARRRLRPRVTR